MNRSFLDYVAADMVGKIGQDLSRTTVVFPNKRASLFMNECLLNHIDRPIWSPSYISISELFRRHSSRTVADQLKLVSDLHKSFVSKTHINETIDHFYGWGQLLLADFDDIDKNLADAKMLFTNLQNIHELDGNEFLTEEQRKALQHFFTNFEEYDKSELKQRFINLWQHIGEIYEDFNERVREQQIAYEGSLYKEVVLNDDVIFPSEHYVFVGFNMLQQVEQRLFKRLRGEGKALFYWDFDHYYMPKDGNPDDEAGHYIAQYISDFPNELDNQNDEIYDNIRKNKDVTYISTTTEYIQTCYVGDWLKENDRAKDGKKTAIVMCDESLLQSVISGIPPETGEINITTGLPLNLSPVSSLIFRLLDVKTSGYKKSSDRYTLTTVSKLLRHPYMVYLSENAELLCNRLNAERCYHPTSNELAIDENLSLLFSQPSVDNSEKSNDGVGIAAILRWMMSILRIIGVNSRENKDPLMQESVFRSYTLLDRLATIIEDEKLAIDATTLRRLIKQIVDTTSIPFHGEPAVGVQVMGILETRNLDFDHVLILSCNEGKMPRGVNDASFIPYSLRKAFGLTTVDHKIAIYSYYFHSLLQRAKDVTIMYNVSTENGHTGEMSRFMLQFMVESGHEIRRKQLLANNLTRPLQRGSIAKTDAVMSILGSIERISPSAINRFLRCPLQFYYNYVAGIKEPDEVDDGKIDNRAFGNIFHKAAQMLYTELMREDGLVQKEGIDAWLNNGKSIERIVDEAFAEEFFKSQNKRRTPDYNGLQLINKEVIIRYLRQLLKIDLKQSPLHILGLEMRVDDNVEIKTSTGQHRVSISGIIDRLDMVKKETGEQVIRIIDYKTGKSAQSKIKTIQDIFGTKNISKTHSDYYLQTFLYSDIVSRSKMLNECGLPVSPALYFITQSSNDNYNPTLTINDESVTDIKKYSDEFSALLKQTLENIFEPSQPFSPTTEKEHCKQCPYRQICEA